MSRLAVVLFNLGGPDSPDAIRPFLFNLFNDPAIIGAPSPIRWALAQFISRRREATAREIYAQLGGRSPILELTRDQAEALTVVLADRGHTAMVSIAMRYWHPMTAEAVAEVQAFEPDEVVLLPLYPQFSTTTTGSSLEAWQREADRAGLKAREHAACCYPTEPGWIAAQAELVSEGVQQAAAQASSPPRILFSAHGLPKKIVASGDPYQWQVEQTAAAVVAALPGNVDHVVCYQSRVGPLEWIGPSTEAELERAGRDGVPIVVVPIAFVSEHSETLVELDVEYREIASQLQIPAYVRVPAVGTNERFIRGLADVVEAVLRRSTAPAPPGNQRLCPMETGRCPCAAG